MRVNCSKLADFDSWIALAREGKNRLTGGIVISKETNEIAWLAVSQKYHRKGYGRKLVEFAISKLNQRGNIYVQTYDESVPEGGSARKRYSDMGFTKIKDGGLNPAGIPTVIMQRTQVSLR